MLTFTVQVTDADGLSGEDTVTVTVVPPDAAPLTVAAPTSFAVVEGETAVGTLNATTSDSANLTWSIEGGADSASFTLSSGGVLAFAAAKDYEAPDDSGGDGTYAVTVQVSDGTQNARADISVSLSNRNEAPTADAGSDQSGIEEGATVTLTGRGEDPDANDTLQYAWRQTGGETVRRSAPSAAETTFTAPSGLREDEVLTFTVQVTDAGGLSGEDTVTVVTIAAPEPPDGPELTARFDRLPASHNGSTPFPFVLFFSEGVDVSSSAMRADAFTVGNGRVVEAPWFIDKEIWVITVAPAGNREVTIVLPGGRACGTPGAICTSDGRALTGTVQATVPWLGQ